MRRTLAIVFILAFLAPAGAETASPTHVPVLIALDVSKSIIDKTTWNKIGMRVLADALHLPPGTPLRIVTFGSSVHSPPVFEGRLDSGAARELPQMLGNLKPSEDWTFFGPVFAEAVMWLRSSGGRGILLTYSDGETSLPNEEFADLPVEDALAGGALLQYPFHAFVWRPQTGTYAVVAAAEAEGPGGEELASLDAALERAGAATSPAEALSPPDVISFDSGNSLVADWGKEMSPAGIATIVALVLAVVGLPVFARRWNGGIKSWATGLPEFLLRSPFGLFTRKAKQSPPTRTQPVETLTVSDSRERPHLEVMPPDGGGAAGTIIALPTAKGSKIFLSPKFEDSFDECAQWVRGIPIPLSFRSGEDDRIIVTNLGDKHAEVETPHGNICLCAPGQEETCYLGDAVHIKGGWTVSLRHPRSELEREVFAETTNHGGAL